MPIERRVFIKFAIISAISPWGVLNATGSSIAKANELTLPTQLVCPIHYWHETASQSQFERYIVGINQGGYLPVTLSDVAEYFATGNQKWPQDRKPMVITFDDGLLSQYLNAEPVLERWKMAATYAVMPNFWGDGVHKYMNNDQVRQIAQNRELASHTLSHFRDLPQRRLTNPSSWKEEIVDSKSRLEDIIGKEVQSMVYPYGNYDKPTADLVSEYYKIAVRTRGGTLLTANELFYLPRQPM